MSRVPPHAEIATQRPDWLAGHVRLELRNVVAKYPFERSRRSSPRSAEFWPRRLFAFELRGWRYAARASRARTSAGCLRGCWSTAETAGIAAIWVRRRPIEQHHCALCAGLFRPRERVWWSRPASLRACSSPPPAPVGLRGV